MAAETALGELLRARREQVGPQELGLPAGGSRRVAGLRREEVALPAGVSTDYYVRLEQGRERNPSAQVVDALARGLALDDDAVTHLHRLARPAPARRRRARPPEKVSPNLQRPRPAADRLPSRAGQPVGSGAGPAGQSRRFLKHFPEPSTTDGVFAVPETPALPERNPVKTVLITGGTADVHRLDVNVRGLLHGIAAVLPHFRRRGGGHFVTIASTGAHEVVPTAAVYCGTKYAARAITEGLRLEAGPGIRVTTISPGVTDSELADSITEPCAREAMRAYRAVTLPADAITGGVSYAIGQPDGVDVNEIIVRPSTQR